MTYETRKVPYKSDPRTVDVQSDCLFDSHDHYDGAGIVSIQQVFHLPRSNASNGFI